MTIARVTAHDGTGSTSATFGGTPTSGNLLLAVVADTATSGATISGWTSIVSIANASLGTLYIFGKSSAGNEGTISPTPGSGGLIICTSVCEYSGAKNPFAQDGTAATASSTANGTSLASAAITTTDAGSLICVAALNPSSISGESWSSGTAILSNTNSGLFTKTIAGEYIPGSTQTSFTNTHSWTGSTTKGIVLIAGFKPVPVPAPTVSSVTASSAVQTQTLDVTVTGTGFVSGGGLSTSFSGTGITVNSTTFVSSTSLTVNITISATATTGLRNCTVTNPDTQTGTGTNVFTVLAKPIGVPLFVTRPAVNRAANY